MSVKLDNGTDAGEFLYQQLHLLPEDKRAAVQFVLASEAVSDDLADAIGNDASVYDTLLSGLGQWGMEFESLAHRGEMDEDAYNLAERGVCHAEQFVRNARAIARKGGA